MLNTFHLRTFLAVVEAGSFTAAADMLHMSQPAVSQHIRALEDQLGDVKLFRRVGQRMVPTHVGEELLTSARDLVALAERAEQHILSLKGQVVGRVTIGCTPSSGERVLPGLLVELQAHFPGIGPAVEVAPAELLMQALAAQQVTLLLIEEQQRRRMFESYLLGSESLALVAPPGHPLLQQEQAPPGVLREQALVLPRPGSPMRRAIDEGLRKRGVVIAESQVRLETDSVGLMIQAVRAGLGLAFVPNTRLPAADAVGAVDLAGAPIQQDWYVLRLRERNPPRAAQELYNFLTGPAARAILTSMGMRVQGEG